MVELDGLFVIMFGGDCKSGELQIFKEVQYPFVHLIILIQSINCLKCKYDVMTIVGLIFDVFMIAEGQLRMRDVFVDLEYALNFVKVFDIGRDLVFIQDM